MTINFSQILQDSWNFMRNQRKFVFTLILFFCLASLIINLLGSSLFQTAIETSSTEMGNKNDISIMMQRVQSDNFLVLYLVNQLITFVLSAWGLFGIHQISQGQAVNYTQSTKSTLNGIIGFIMLNIIISLPLAIGLINILPAIVNSSNTTGLFGIILVILGTYIYIRLCLTPIHYLTTKVTLLQAIQQIWQMSHKRVAILFIYCLLIYFLIPALTQQIAFLATNITIDIIATLLIATISVFVLIISYRFYILFNQKA
ncbi:hypothetical protein [Pasteurella bettyae]|uniref:Putative membrane protein n=1 Tax=Pasteurella bettyae CCUG 2042 TaxID=1095749 RepID=I3D7J6_9PAST|nr:hypothetical protein [Pasteurella bettyae]EIJ67689.1 putative membrane protein [Pasteurella bettyae CCUG 2042]SUB22099.1 Uncharacterised protein family (UPF0259) [Pasteurella bettyae]